MPGLSAAGTGRRQPKSTGPPDGRGGEGCRVVRGRRGVPTTAARRSQAIAAGVAGGLLNPEGNRFTAGLAGCGRGSPAGAPARPLRSQSRNAPAHSWQMTRGLRIQLRKSPPASSVEWRSISTSPQRMQQSRAMGEVYSGRGSQTSSTRRAAPEKTPQPAPSKTAGSDSTTETLS